MALWVIRILFLVMCTVAGFALSQMQPLLVTKWYWGAMLGFGFGGLMVAVDELLKGFSLRSFTALSFGLFIGSVIAWLIDRSGLFQFVEDNEPVRWLIRLGLFLGFGYIGMVLAMRSNKEDFSLIIPYVRLARENRPDNLIVLDTSVIIDGRIADLIEANFIEGVLVVPRFVLKELHVIGDSSDPIKRARGRRGLDMLGRIQRNTKNEVKIHEADFPEETTTDGKLVRLASALKAKLYTNDYNLGKIAELQSVTYVNLAELASAMKPVILPGESLNIKLVREGREKHQGVGYLPDGTMVVVNEGHALIGQQVHVVVSSLLQTGAGVIVFADAKKQETA